MPAVINDLEIQMFGLERSGNHAIVEWMARQYEAPITFLNNVRPFEDPYASFEPARVRNIVRVGMMDEAELLAHARAPKKLLLYSYENLDLAALDGRPLVDREATHLGASGAFRRGLVLRDFYNWAASRVKMSETRGTGFKRLTDTFESFIALWLAHAREFVGETSHLVSPNGGRAVPISYNRWVADRDYRIALLGALALPFRSDALSEVAAVGGGSSFDGMIDGDARAMRVEERWKYLLEDKCALLLPKFATCREEITALNERIFGIGWPFG